MRGSECSGGRFNLWRSILWEYSLAPLTLKPESGADTLNQGGVPSPSAPQGSRLQNRNLEILPCKSITILIIQVNRALTTICQDFDQSWSLRSSSGSFWMRTTESLLKSYLGPDFYLQDEGVLSWVSWLEGVFFPPLYVLLIFFWALLISPFKWTILIVLSFHRLQAVLISEKFSSTRTVGLELSPTAKSEVDSFWNTSGCAILVTQITGDSETRLNCKHLLRQGLCPGLFLWLITVQMSWLR